MSKPNNNNKLPHSVQQTLDKTSKQLHRLGFSVLSVTHDPIPSNADRTYVVFRHKDCVEMYMEELQSLVVWLAQPTFTYSEIKAIVEKRLDYDPDIRVLALKQLGERIGLTYQEAFVLRIDVDMSDSEDTFIKQWSKDKEVKRVLKTRTKKGGLTW